MGKDYSVLCVLKYIYIIKKNYRENWALDPFGFDN